VAEKDDTKGTPFETGDGEYVGVAPEYANAAYEQNRPLFGEGEEKARAEYALQHAEDLAAPTTVHGYRHSKEVGAVPGSEEEGAGAFVALDPDAPEMRKGSAPLAPDQLDDPEGEEESATKSSSKSSGGGTSKASVVPPE
jgi:hypothetical protein